MSIKIAVGLGNTGARYTRTRHNAGLIALETLAELTSAPKLSFNKYAHAYLSKGVVAGKELILVFLEGYMNESGIGLAKVLKYLKADISEVVVLYDDITLDVGRMKVSLGGSAGGHNGVSDIMNRCGNSFARFRIGIGAKIDKRMDLADHVLGLLSDDDIKSIKALPIKECFSLMLTKGVDATQNVMNRKPQKPKESTKPQSEATSSSAKEEA